MEFLKSIGGKIVTGVVALGVIAAAVAFWQSTPEQRSAFFGSAFRIVGWFVLVFALPWAAFMLIGYVAKLKSNAAGAALVFSLSLFEIILLAWLFKFDISGSVEWILLAAAGLIAAVYNVLTCDWIAEKLE